MRAHWSADTLEREFPDRFDSHGFLYGHQYARTDQDLTRLRLVAQPRGDIRHRADSRIIEAPFEADRAERRVAVRDADAKAEFVPQLLPPFDQRADRCAHVERHLHRL